MKTKFFKINKRWNLIIWCFVLTAFSRPFLHKYIFYNHVLKEKRVAIGKVVCKNEVNVQDTNKEITINDSAPNNNTTTVNGKEMLNLKSYNLKMHLVNMFKT